MSEPVTLRLAMAADVPTVGQVTGDAYAADDLFCHDTGYEREVRAAESRFHDGEIWVAELDGEIVGSVTYCPPGSFHRELARDDEGEFRMLGVAKSARGRGIGRRLVQICIDRARDQQLRALVICSMAEMTSAHALYGDLGFVRDPALDWSPAEHVELWAYLLLLTE